MLTAKEGEEATAEAIRVVDRFEAWCIRRDEVHAQHDCDLWEKRFNALVDKRWKAQLAVIHAPAPDFDAVRVKLELLAAMMLGDTQRLLAA
jgi:hypothetical protein